jgi:hypothetical protein
MLNIGENVFYEKINLVKLKYILKNKDKYKERIEKERRHKDDEKQVPIWVLMKNIYKKCIPIPNTEYGFIPVKYKKGYNSNNIGRWYADKSIGLAPLCSLVRHTICDDLWYDIDQVNSHVNIMNHFINKFELKSPSLDKCINNREEVFKIVMDELECDRGEAKSNIISCLNGKNYKSGFLKQLQLELMPCLNKMIEMDEYIHIYKDVKRNAKYNYVGKTISKILQVIENDMLESYLEYCIDNNLITKYKDHLIASLVFDGFQLEKKLNLNDDILDDIRKYCFEKTGYDIPLKLKDMDNKLDIPDDYNDIDIENDEEEEDEEEEEDCTDLKSYEDLKKEFELTHFKVLYPPAVYTINNNDDDNDNDNDKLQNMKSTRDSYGHLKCFVLKPSSKKSKKCIKIKEPKLFIHQWLADHNIRLYKSICWKPPPYITNNNVYNTWKEFDISNHIIKNSSTDYVKQFLTFCENLFESKEVMNYLLSRYAFRLQNPGLRTNVCVIYYGDEGGGKSTFIDTIYSVFGKYAIQIDKAKKLYESHSTFEKEKCFICVNEAGGTDNFENSEVLKTRITENKLYINPKGLQAYEIDNFCDYDMTTNNVNVVKITDHSTRRWFQHTCTSHYLGNVEFFNDYRTNIIYNDDALKQIYDYLINYDWKDIIKSGNFQDDNYKPRTEVSKTVKECNRDKLIWFYKYLVDDSTNEDENTITCYNCDLFRRWNHWCDTNKIERKMNNIQFGIKTHQLNERVKNRTGQHFIKKDTHGKNTITGSVFNEYYDYLVSL